MVSNGIVTETGKSEGADEGAHDEWLKRLVPPARIERATFGLGISGKGMLKSLTTWAIPATTAGATRLYFHFQ